MARRRSRAQRGGGVRITIGAITALVLIIGAATLLATRDETWLAALSEAVTVETDARKLEILDDALALRAGTPLVDGLLRRVRAKGRRKG